MLQLLDFDRGIHSNIVVRNEHRFLNSCCNILLACDHDRLFVCGYRNLLTLETHEIYVRHRGRDNLAIFKNNATRLEFTLGELHQLAETRTSVLLFAGFAELGEHAAVIGYAIERNADIIILVISKSKHGICMSRFDELSTAIEDHESITGAIYLAHANNEAIAQNVLNDANEFLGGWLLVAGLNFEQGQL